MAKKVNFASQRLMGALIALQLTSPFLFFSFLAILGREYEGKEGSSVYTLFLIVVNMLSILVFLVNARRVHEIQTKFYWFVMLPIIMILFSFLAGPWNEFAISQASLFVVLCLPAILSALMTVKFNLFSEILSFLQISALIVSVSVVCILPILMKSSVIDLMSIYGGGQYQFLSYSCSFSFLVLLYSLLERETRKKGIKSFIRLLVYYGSLLVLIGGIFLSGGRGGMLVAVCGSAVLIVRRRGFIFLLVYIIRGLFILTLLVLFFFKGIVDFERLIESSNRLFSFISNEGLDFSGSSNRDTFYLVALEYIGKKWFLGFGLFGISIHLGSYYPHNFFLEVMLQFGIVGLTSVIVIILFYGRRLLRIIKKRTSKGLLILSSIYILVLLMVSSSYLIEPMFWYTCASLSLLPVKDIT